MLPMHTHVHATYIHTGGRVGARTGQVDGTGPPRLCRRVVSDVRVWRGQGVQQARADRACSTVNSCYRIFFWLFFWLFFRYFFSIFFVCRHVRRIVHALVRALAPRLRALDVRRVSLLLERLLLVLRQHICCYRMSLCRHDLSSSSSSSAAAGSQFTCVTSTKYKH